MIRSVLLHSLLVFLPTLGLSVFAWHAADQDYADGLAAMRKRIEDEADVLAQRMNEAVAASLEDARDKIEKAKAALREGESQPLDAVVGFAKEGEWLGYFPEPFPAEEAVASEEELRLFRLSLRGGESFEFEIKDPPRALDAYSFYLPRIHSPVLRARLLLRMARAALQGGENALGAAILRQLAGGEAGGAFEEGIPIDLLALLLLQGEKPPAPGLWWRELHDLLCRRERSISTALLAHLVKTHPEGFTDFERLVEKRRELDGWIGKHPEILDARNAVFAPPDGLLLAMPTSAGNPPNPLRAILRTSLSLPATLRSGDLIQFTALEAEASPARRPRAPEDGWTSRTLFLGQDGPPFAAFEVLDGSFRGDLKALARRRDLLRALVWVLLAVTLAGGAVLLRAIERERALIRLRSRLLANVSHELKTPITSIRMFSEMLAEAPHDADRTRRFGELLQVESLRLSGLIQNVLDFSRPAGSRKPRAREPVDVDAFLKGLGEGFSLLARQSGVEFTLETAGCGSLRTDARALERILLNLLDNALKYRSPEKGPAKSWIRLKAVVDGTRVKISVADNGIGIARADQERIFEEFYRARFEDYAVPGAGLGLSIARRLARELGGEITLESKLGEGSTFTLVLPRGAKEPV